MAKKMIKLGTAARKAIQTGVNTVVDAVSSSYGPLGRNSVIENYGTPNITNDGVTIAKAIELEGFEQMGVSIIQQAANKTNDEAGDGTSLTTILAGSLINEGIRVVEAGSDPVKVRGGLIKASDFVLDYISKQSKMISTKEEMTDVATISSRRREIGEMIAEILTEVGKDGVVTIQNGDTNKIEKEVVQGMQFDKGYKSPYFVTDSTRMEAVAEKPFILVTDRKVSTIQEVLPVLEQLAQQGKKELVIIADDVEGDALANFIVNKIRGVFNIFAVQAPAFGDRRKAMLQDIAVLTGATFISSDLGMQLKSVTLEDLGSADKVVSDKDKTTIVGGKGDKDLIEARIAEIRKDIENTDSDYDREKLQERLAKLAGGVGVIKVGAATEVQMKELKYLVEDALNATKAAVKEGVVSGGASTLLRAGQELDKLIAEATDAEEKVGITIVKKALEYPFRTIAKNSGIYDISLIAKDILAKPNSGYDFRSDKFIENMLDAGIIDPAMVVRQAVGNATSVATSILTTEVIIADESKKDEPKGAGMPDMSGMGGMM
jgi:chaperonin GroEL